jgi:protein tyrosine/serine phosphatase
MLRLIVVLLLILVFFIAMGRQTGEEGDLPRFSMLTQGLYRGGQPTTKGFQFLNEIGVKTIINLRAEDNSESGVVQGLGMNYVQIPVNEARPWSVIPPAAIAKFFELVSNPANYPIFFHCRRGADRTGAVAAFYRIAIDHWDGARAYAEARDIGMRWYYAALRAQILDFHPR